MYLFYVFVFILFYVFEGVPGDFFEEINFILL